MSTNFAFLVLEEHPYGREMLKKLLEHNLTPSVIIQEVSKVAEKERCKFLRRQEGQPTAPFISTMIKDLDIPCLSVTQHNKDERCRASLEEYQPDLVVLGGTRIIREPTISYKARNGFVNVHPGLLPWLRGSASIGWALYKDMKMGSTVHFIDANIDTGDIILREELPVYRDDTYESLSYRVSLLSAKLMTDVVRIIDRGGEVPIIPQEEGEEALRVIPDDLLAEGIARLREGRYSHYSDLSEEGTE
jgi:methionyl-tRNA formyltransferase